MTTSARLCASCGSALPETPHGVLQVKCLFCGVVNDLTSASGPVTIHVDAGNAVRAAATVGRTVVWVVSLAIILAIGGAGMGLYVATRSVTQVSRTIADTVVRQSQPRPVAPADLAASTARGWQTLDVPAPPTAWAAFDPVAGLGWALDIGRAWRADAVLTRIDVSRLTPAGTVNLEGSADDSAGYRFISPGQVKDWDGLERSYRKMIARVAGKGKKELEFSLLHSLGLIYRDRLQQLAEAIRSSPLRLRKNELHNTVRSMFDAGILSREGFRGGFVYRLREATEGGLLMEAEKRSFRGGHEGP